MKTERSGVSEKANASDSGRYAETKTPPSEIAAQGSFKRQIILTFVVGFFFLIAAFSAYQVRTERAYLYRDSTDETTSLAESLAASSRSWVLANDVVGLQEVVHSLQGHAGMHYAMVISPSGRVLAHSDATKIGQFISDEVSLTLIKSPPVKRVMIDDESMIDIAVPIMVGNKHVGWARAAQGRENIVGYLHNMMLSSALFVLVAVALSLFAALYIANRLGFRVSYLMRVAEDVQAGNYAVRAKISGGDEIARLANSFDHMLDVLAREEVQLRESEALLQATMKILPVGLWVFDAEGKIVFSNDAAKQLWAGLRYVGIEQLGEYKGWRLGSRESIGAHEWAGARALEKGETSIEEEIEIECFDGTHKIILDSAVPLRRSDGSIRGAVTINQDITERKQAEESTRVSQARFSTIFKQAPLGIALIDSNTGRIYEVNPRFAEIAGRTMAEMETIDWMSITHPDDVQEDLDNMALLNAGKIPDFRMDKRYLRPDGSFVWINMTIAPLRGEQNISPRHLCMIDDITERKKAERELRELNNDFVTLLENSGDYIYFKDKDSRIRFCSQTLASITGHHSWREMVGKHDLEIFPKDTARIYYEEELPIFRDGMPLLNKTDPYYDEHGKPGWVNTNKWPVFGDDKKTVVGIFGISRDITELKEAEDKITELNRDLERRVTERTAQLASANKELEAFSYSVSHDLRTPLRAIDGFSHILLDDYAGKLDDEGRRLLNVVRDNTSRMGQLIDDILKFSRTGRLELVFSEIDMEGLAREVVEELQPASSKLQVKVEPIPQATGDRAMMHQVFVNLLSNAIKFSRARETAMIQVGGSIKGDEAVYYVKDNGVGFDMQYADKLFGVFQRLHAMSEFEGTGIGLAIVKRVITRHGGRVWAEGKIGEGATIYFALPIKEIGHG